MTKTQWNREQRSLPRSQAGLARFFSACGIPISRRYLIEKAHRLLDRAECFPVKASRRVLAEIPSAPWELWALGSNEDAALAALCVVIVEHLSRKECGS